jgi:repressor LexA
MFVPDISPRQQKILDFIREYVRRHGYPPSVREIGAAVNLRSSSTVHGHLARLEAKGYLRRDPSKPRTIELLRNPPAAQGGDRGHVAPGARRVPVLGRVAAGQPILAVEDAEETFPLPTEWIRDEDVFMLTVDGESMIEAGILPGDLLVVRRQPTAYNGDIVVALLGDEVTVKRFFREAGRIRLQPENSSMQPIYATQVQILGKVIGLVRRM